RFGRWPSPDAYDGNRAEALRRPHPCSPSSRPCASILRGFYPELPGRHVDLGQAGASGATPDRDHPEAEALVCPGFCCETRSVTSRATATAPCATPSTATRAKVSRHRASVRFCAARGSRPDVPEALHETSGARRRRRLSGERRNLYGV